MKLFAIPALLLLICGCDAQLKLGKTEDIFVIKKDTHRSAMAFRPFTGTVLQFEAELNETTKYITKDPGNQSDINKLLGFSDCESYHHINSARFGWRWLNGKMEILAYVYDNGQRKYEFITTVPLNQKNTYKIIKATDGYVFVVNDRKKVKVETSATCNGTADEILWPYFGGNEKAPHDIELVITNIKIDPETSS